LSDWFGILVECDETGENIRYFVSLIVLDLYRLNCKKIHTVEYVAKNVEIYVNELNPATFVMGLSIEDQYVAHICKIAGQTITKAKIIVGDPIQLPLVCDYSDGVFHSFIGRENEYELIRVCFFQDLRIFKYFRMVRSFSTTRSSKKRSVWMWICPMDTMLLP
jgi:hypothetical protein